jgi:hypothetical protein
LANQNTTALAAVNKISETSKSGLFNITFNKKAKALAVVDNFYSGVLKKTVAAHLTNKAVAPTGCNTTVW